MKGSKRLRPDRDNQWQLRVDAGRDPVTGKRRQRSRMFTGTAREADRELARMVTAYSDDLVTTDGTVAHLLRRWYDHTRDHLSPSTRQGYEWRLPLIEQAIGDIPLAKLTAQHLDAFYLGLSRTGGKTGRGQAPATIGQTHRIVHRALEQGVAWGWLRTNPARFASPPREHRDERDTIPVERMLTILRAAEDHPEPNLAPFLRVAAATGARRGELCALRWSRIDWERRTMLVAASIVQLRGQGWVEKPPKTRARRLVQLDPGTVGVLAAHQAHQEAICRAAGVSLGEWVFQPDPTAEGPWLPDRVTGLWRRLPGTDGFRLHDVRHFHVSVLLDRGETVEVASRRVGHSQTSTTHNVYSHRMEGSDARAALIIGGVLDG